MQTSRRRRTTARLNTDNYNPKSKSNDKKQTLYIIIGAIVLVIVLFVLYKSFSSSSPPRTDTDTSADTRSSVNTRTRIDEVVEKNFAENVYDDTDMETDMETDIKRDFPPMNNPNMDNPNMDMNQMSHKVNPNMFRKKDERRGNEGGNHAFRGNPMDSIKRRANMNRKIKPPFMRRFDEPMMEDRRKRPDSPFNAMGEGPIFNQLNQRDGKPKLSPQQVHAARQNMKNNMRGQFGAGAFQNMNEMRGMPNINEMRQRGHEM